MVEDARSALRPRGIGASRAHVSSVCAAVRHLSVLRSGTRLLLTGVSRRGPTRLCARGAPPSPTHSGRPSRSSRPATGLSRAAARDGSRFHTGASIRQTGSCGPGLGPFGISAALHRLWAVACGALVDPAADSRPLAPLSGRRWSWNFTNWIGATTGYVCASRPASAACWPHLPTSASSCRSSSCPATRGTSWWTATNACAACTGCTAIRSPRSSGTWRPARP